MANDTATTNDTAMVSVSGDKLQAQNHGVFDLPSNQFELETKQELMRLDAELEAVALRMVKSRDLINVSFDIVDATFTTLQVKDGNGGLTDKLCVQFVLELQDGERITCTKSANKFNNVYANAFNGWRGIAEKRLSNYTFEIDERWSVADNPAVVLRKAQTQPKQINKR